jgi:hypothetical protein
VGELPATAIAAGVAVVLMVKEQRGGTSVRGWLELGVVGGRRGIQNLKSQRAVWAQELIDMSHGYRGLGGNVLWECSVILSFYVLRKLNILFNILWRDMRISLVYQYIEVHYGEALFKKCITLMSIKVMGKIAINWRMLSGWSGAEGLKMSGELIWIQTTGKHGGKERDARRFHSEWLVPLASTEATTIPSCWTELTPHAFIFFLLIFFFLLILFFCCHRSKVWGTFRKNNASKYHMQNYHGHMLIQN